MSPFDYNSWLLLKEKVLLDIIYSYCVKYTNCPIHGQTICTCRWFRNNAQVLANMRVCGQIVSLFGFGFDDIYKGAYLTFKAP